MNTRITYALILSSLMAVPTVAQPEHDRLLNELKASESRSLIIGDKRYDLVGPDYNAAATNKNALLRVTTRVVEGWAVRVVANDGDPLMSGTYADEELAVAHGTFTYYHSNDRVESVGAYNNGVKTGVWSRYDTSGNLLGERIYKGLDTDELLVKERVLTRAADK